MPAVLAGGTCGAYYYKLHRLCSAMTLQGLPALAAPTPEERILVLSPHCDDETLGAGAYIADARRAGTPVTVAFLTNGDGFRVAASRTLHEVSIGPADFVRFAEKRQEESVAALSELGVPDRDVVFLGYPDRGLRPMWETNWEPTNPFRSGFTGHTHSPYKRTFTPHTPYSGASLVTDLTRLMEQARPTEILVTHPADDHPDHYMAPAFAQAALRECRSRGDAWAAKARLRYYIVHRGDWPLPQGAHPDSPLLPPPGLITGDSRWDVYPVGDAARSAKTRALERYVSQVEITGRFLRSFVRTNELQAVLPEPRIAADHSGPPTISGCETATSAGLSDNIARYVEPPADVVGLSVREEGNMLRVRLTLRGDVSGRIRYTVQVRGCESVPSSSTPATRLVSRDLMVPTGHGAGRWVEGTIPLSALGLKAPGRERVVWVSAETHWNKNLPYIDRTGYRPFRLEDRIEKTAAPADNTRVMTRRDTAARIGNGI